MRIVDNKSFTKREKEIALLILSGKNKREIANLLFLSISTIKTNVENLYAKFGVHNKAEFIIYIVKHNLIVFDEND